MLDLKDKIKRYFAFTKEEIKSLTIVILLLGFIIGFNDGRASGSIDFFYGLNMISSIIIVALTVLVHVATQRIIALQAGYKLVFRLWWYGLAASVILAFVTNGKFWVLLPGGIVAMMLEKHRLGKFRYGLNYWPLGLIGFAGPLANVLLALFLRMITKISIFSGNVLLEKAILVNLVYAVFTYLPIPPLDGFNLMYASRLTYFFTAGLILGAGLLIWLQLSVFWTLLGSLAIGTIVWGTYYHKMGAKR